MLKNVGMVRSTLEEMKESGFFNASTRDDNMRQLSLASARFLLKADAFTNMCLPPQRNAKCVVPANAKKKTWKKVPLFELCRTHCNANSADSSSFCCMHHAKSSTCLMVWPSNSTEPSGQDAPKTTAAICKPFPVLQVLQEFRLLKALATSVLRD